MTLSLRAELAGKGISVVGVFPGGIDTDMLAGVDARRRPPRTSRTRSSQLSKPGLRTSTPTPCPYRSTPPGSKTTRGREAIRGDNVDRPSPRIRTADARRNRHRHRDADRVALDLRSPTDRRGGGRAAASSRAHGRLKRRSSHRAAAGSPAASRCFRYCRTSWIESLSSSVMRVLASSGKPSRIASRMPRC